MNNPKQPNGSVAPQTGVVAEMTDDQRILNGMASQDERIYSDIRALKSLDTGDPVGLEALDFGSVRGKPAVSFTTRTGEKRVMMVSMPTWMASLKSRSEFRQQARDHAVAEARRQDMIMKIGPKFERAMESLIPQYGDLFGSLMTEAFQEDPMKAAQYVLGIQRTERGSQQKAAQAVQAVTGNLLSGRSQRSQAAVQAALKQREQALKSSIEMMGLPASHAQQRLSELNQSGQNTGVVHSVLASPNGASTQVSLSQRLQGNDALTRRFYNAMFDELTRGATVSGGRTLTAALPGSPDDSGSMPNFLSSVSTYLAENGYVAPLTEADVAQIVQQALRYNGNSNPEFDVRVQQSMMDSLTGIPHHLETQEEASSRFASDQVATMQAQAQEQEDEMAREEIRSVLARIVRQYEWAEEMEKAGASVEEVLAKLRSIAPEDKTAQTLAIQLTSRIERFGNK